jgi:peptidoglycan/LPS O-acetylase OafA/YrhL
MPALDGVRGIAIILVMAYHLMQPQFPGGGVLGVDAFFVLSAFLITSLLMTEHRGSGGRVDFRTFYLHRFLRLAPALVLFLAIFAPWATSVANQPAYLQSTLKSIFYVMDFAAAGIGLHGAPVAYRHVWSLSIEEQFYFVWPCALLYIVLRRPHASRLRLSAFAVVVAWAIEIGSHFAIGAGRTYFFISGHLVPLALGCLAAELAVHGAPSWVTRAVARPAVATMACVFFGLAVFGWRGPVARLSDFGPSAATALAVMIVILHIAGTPDGPVVRVLSTPPLRWFGSRSYGLYLYHVPIWIIILLPPLGNAHLPTAPRVILTFLASMLVAELSFRYVERPIARFGRRRLDRHQAAAPKTTKRSAALSGRRRRSREAQRRIVRG